ncbi:MAG: dockerin type I domain-containing protein [Phycisphaerae bacterium]
MALLLSAAAASAQPCETIILRSGQVAGLPGSPGQLDDIVRRHATVALSGQLSATPFNAAWFNPAQTGPAAMVVGAYPGWITSLPCDPQARWINYNDNDFHDSVLYAIPFDITSPCIENATIELCWAVDDSLGDPSGGANTTGVYVNGLATAPVISGGTHTTHSTATRTITGQVIPGLNWLYLYQRDIGAHAAGIIFSARIDIECDPCCFECPPGVTPQVIGYEAGRDDSFAGPVDPVSPRVPLSNYVTSIPRSVKSFDECVENTHWFAHTFKNLPGNIVAAQLEITMKAGCCADSDNDTISLLHQGGTAFAWANRIDALGGPANWSAGVVSTFVLDLCALPTASGTVSIIPQLSAARLLDIMVQDDTCVDYARLCITVCPCDAPYRTYRAGKNDNFRTWPGFIFKDPQPFRRPELNAIRTTWKGFDSCQIDAGMGHSFNIPFGGVVEAHLTTRIRACETSLSTNDSLSLDLKSSGGPAQFNWGSAISALVPAGPWTTGTTKTISINLGSTAPTAPGMCDNMLGSLADNWLDFYVQDDTAVDYIDLRVKYCPPPLWHLGAIHNITNAGSTALPAFTFSPPVEPNEPNSVPAMLAETAGGQGWTWQLDPPCMQNLPLGTVVRLGFLGDFPVRCCWAATNIVVDEAEVQFSVPVEPNEPGSSILWYVDDTFPPTRPPWDTAPTATVSVNGKDISSVACIKNDPCLGCPPPIIDDWTVVTFAQPRTFTSSLGHSATASQLIIGTLRPVAYRAIKEQGVQMTVALPFGAAPATIQVLGGGPVFGDRRTTVLGLAHLDANEGSLGISGLGSTGNDGVSIDVGNAEAVDVHFEIGSTGNDGAFIEQAFVGSLGGVGGQDLGYSRVTRTGPEMEIDSDYSPAGTTIHRVQVLRDDRLVSEHIVPPSIAVRVDSTEWPIRCSKRQVLRDFGPPVACGRWKWRDECAIWVGGASGVLGDEVRILAENANGAFDYLEHYAIRAAGIEELVLIGSETTQADTDPVVWHVPVVEDFENYAIAELCAQSDWNAWSGSAAGCGQVTREQASSGSSSVKIVGNIAGTPGDDTVLSVNLTQPLYDLEIQTFVPQDATGTGWFVLLNTYPEPFNWSPNVFFNADNNTVGDLQRPTQTLPLIRGQWVTLRMEIDLANDLVTGWYNEQQFIDGVQWTNSGSTNGQPRIQAIDLYAGEPTAGGTSGMYFDDLVVSEVCIPTAPPCPGDLNGDGVVNLSDLAGLLANFGTSGGALPHEGDTDGDGDVDLSDLAIVLGSFGAVCP